MKAWGVVSTAVLALIPALALYWQGDLSFATTAGAQVAPVVVVDDQPVQDKQPAVVLPGLPAPAGDPAPDPAPAPAPVPVPAPVAPVVRAPAISLSGQASPANWTRAPRLEAAVAKAMADFPGQYSVAVADLNSGNHWVLNPGERYHPASTIKMVVSLYALEQHRAGKLSWQQPITYTAGDYESPGGGDLEAANFGDQYPVGELVTRALRDSNNIAVNMLGRYLGWDNIRAWSRSIDAPLYRLTDATPQVTVMSELGWWQHLYRLSREDPTSAQLLLTPLRNVTYSGRIPVGLPKGVPYLHKYGSYDGYYHDSGIVFADRPYALIVLTSGASEEQADKAIARVSAAVYGVMK